MTLQSLKRIEIVIGSLHLPQMLEALRNAGATGYTVLPHVEGHGERGDQRADEVSGTSANAYVVAAVKAPLVPAITDAVQPLLRSFGGICLISDCQWLEH